jgi:NADPH:quinone reductase-like Zn-dependent oxidoreductase
MFFIVTPNTAQRSRLAQLTEAGELRPVVSQVYPLAEGRAAFESATRPHPPGKTVLLVRRQRHSHEMLEQPKHRQNRP